MMRPNRHTRRIGRALRRGFTLTELMVSLVMGLIVALAAVGLAKTSTTTFYEQARSTTTEGTLRAAANRLRSDLLRTSFMSTGNIVLDPKVAKLQSAGNAPALVGRYPSVLQLRGLRIDNNMRQSDGGGIPATLTTNGIKPDAIELVGNFTTDDAYTGQLHDSAAGSSPFGSCTQAQTIELETSGDAATYTLGGGAAGIVDPVVLLANARAAFLPSAGKQFLANVTDANGCNHYVPVCDVLVAGASPTPKLQVLVQAPASGRAVLFSNSNAADQPPVNNNCGSAENGPVTIAPLQRVRWYLDVSSTPNTAADPAIETSGGATGKKVDLKRDIMDFNGATVFTEVIAEYAVDLKFGIVFDDPAAAGVGIARQKVVDIPIDGVDPNNDLIYTDTADPQTMISGNVGPQRVRAVRFRLSTRTAVPDRQADLPVDAGQIRARYCIGTNIGTCPEGWARVRTVTSEVALINQAGMFY